MCHRKYVSFDRIRPPSRDPDMSFQYTTASFEWARRGIHWLFDR